MELGMLNLCHLPLSSSTFHIIVHVDTISIDVPFPYGCTCCCLGNDHSDSVMKSFLYGDIHTLARLSIPM